MYSYQVISQAEETKKAMEYLWHLEMVEEKQRWTSQLTFLKKLFLTTPWIPVIYTWEFFQATSTGPTDF